MNPQDLQNDEITGDPKHESLLLSLWRKFTSNNRVKEETGQEEEVKAEGELSQPVEVPFEKTAVPTALGQLYIRWKQQSGVEFSETVLIENLCAKPYPATALLERFISQAELQAKRFLDRYDTLDRQNKELIEKYLAEQEKRVADAEPELPDADAEQGMDLSALETSPPLDGEVFVLTAPDWSAAWCMVLPPLGTGKPVEEDTIRDALKLKNVVFGLFDDRIKELSDPENCLTIIPVALGVPAEPGMDGQLTEYFPRDIGTPHFIENAQGIVDFDNLNWLVPIEAGTVICDITLPTKGQAGTDVRGHELKPYNGKKPSLPMGENVILNENSTALIAKVSGQISFKNGKFHVTNTITIPGNVDLSTGSLDVRGDLVIYGNVLAGFHVQASGDITVGGIVEGSQVTAGGSIIVNRGMNGNLVGSLTAGKDIFCKYMENASVQADGDIHMDSIVNCDVSCNGQLIVRSGRGVIIGGNALAMGGIEAKIIGNKAGRLTTLSVGLTPQFLYERRMAEEELEDVEFELKKIRMSTPEGSAVLNLRILELKQSKLKKVLADLAEKEALVAQSRISADKLYPIVQISINSVVKSIIEPCGECRIYLDSKEGKVVIFPR